MVNKNDNIYAPLQDRDGFDARSDGEENRGPLLLVVTIAVLLAFAAVVYTAYHQGLRKGGRDAAPHVTAENEPYKTRPTDTHGKPTPNLGNRAYEPLDDIKPAPIEKIKTAPLTEEPLDRPAKVVVSPPKTKPVPATVPKKVKPTPALTKPKAKPVVTAPVKTKPASIASGKFLVQIAAFRSEAQALAAWSGLATRFSGAAAGLASDVQRADLGSKGIYYRLRASSFADRESAKKFCDQLKKGGRDCLVVRR